MSPDDFARFAEIGVLPSMQPTHLTSDMPWAPSRLGPERIRSAYAWKRFYALTGVDFIRLSPENTTPVIRRWSLSREMSGLRRIFYEQAGATCAYLFHAEGGKYRSQLLDFVVDYYTGKLEKLDPAAAFGIPAEELGKRVTEFAREVAAGRRP